MEREFGAEIARTFGARLKRIYESEDQRLPTQMMACLERLRHAEQTQGTDAAPQRNPDDETESRIVVGVPSPTR